MSFSALMFLSLFAWFGWTQEPPTSETPPAAAAAAPAPEESASAPASSADTLAADADGLSMVVPDGQLRHHPFHVFIPNQAITLGMKPKLCLSSMDTKDWFSPFLVTPHQQLTITHHGQTVSYRGTLMLFDLKEMNVSHLLPMIRVNPILRWQNGETLVEVTRGTPVYYGDLGAAGLWSLLTILILVGTIMLLSRRTQGGLFALIRQTDGRLSLSYFQMTLWTIVIGYITVVFGLIQLEIPEIPDTLVALMGLSLVTSGLSGIKTSTTTQSASNYAIPAKIQQLFCDQVNGVDVVSLPRAQMLFWTVLNVGFFLIKSIVDGVLWEVPAEMVILMGMSQAGYVTPKFFGNAGSEGSPAAPTSPTTGDGAATADASSK